MAQGRESFWDFEPPSPREAVVAIAAAGIVAVCIRRNQKLKERVELDSKTGLLDAEHFRTKVIKRTAFARRERDVGRKHGLLFLDLDNFSSYNTKLGHPRTDELVLIPTVQAIKAATRSGEGDGDLACRFGGEEFVVFVSDAGSYEGLQTAAERVRAGINAVEPYANPQNPASVGVSIGCSVLPQGGDYDLALDQANEAMLRAKEVVGKNQIFMYEFD